MIRAMGDNTFVAVWIVFTVLATAGIIAAFVWAIRSRQFANQDRARYLALRSRMPACGEPDDDLSRDGREVGEKGEGNHVSP